jgi:ABC-type amino acid transport substrate-binding protein
VGAIAGSTNLALAETFEGAVCVPFDGVTDDVFGDMLRSLQTGEVDAVVDDDVAFLGIERSYPDIRVAFTIATRNAWGCALRLGDDDLKRALDDAIAQADLPDVWRQWLPSLPYPL